MVEVPLPRARGLLAEDRAQLRRLDLELFGGLLQGVPTVIVPDDALVEPEALVQTLHDHGVTRIWVVPSLLRALLDGNPDLDLRLPALTFWVTTGEPLSSELYERFAERMPHATLYNVYGTSEFWDATWWDPTREPAPRWRVPIGRPLWNVKAYALDRHGRPVPIGVPGELHVGGDGLPRGYIGRPDLTAERLVPDPLANASEALVWRTGDVVRFLADGNLELLERLDNQIKLRGFRIEPSEIELALLRHPAVEQATAFLRRDPEREDARLVAYVVKRRETETSPPDLRSLLQQTLPAHMIPAAFVFLDELPLTPSGKIDRTRLPEPGYAAQRSSEAVASRNAVEEVLVTIWAELLGVPHVGIEDNFFNDLGGHSLLGTTLVSRVRDAFDVELPLGVCSMRPRWPRWRRRSEKSRLTPPLSSGPRSCCYASQPSRTRTCRRCSPSMYRGNPRSAELKGDRGCVGVRRPAR